MKAFQKIKDYYCDSYKVTGFDFSVTDQEWITISMVFCIKKEKHDLTPLRIDSASVPVFDQQSEDIFLELLSPFFQDNNIFDVVIDHMSTLASVQYDVADNSYRIRVNSRLYVSFNNKLSRNRFKLKHEISNV